MSTPASSNSGAPSTQSSNGPGELHVAGKGWTFGNSNALVEGADQEPAWVSIAWLVVPSVLAVVTIYAMFRWFGG